MLNRISTTVWISGASITLGIFLLPNAVHAEPGFSASCDKLEIYHKSTNEPILKANCKNRFGDWQQAEIYLNRYVANMNGSLVWLEKGNFAEFCRMSAALEPKPGVGIVEKALWGPRGPVMVATCRTDKGDYKTSKLNLDERIFNRNGNLVYKP